MKVSDEDVPTRATAARKQSTSQTAIRRHTVEFDAVAPGTHPGLIFSPYKSTVKRGPAQPRLHIHARAAGSSRLSAGAGL
jgi:hypothetical protein